MSDETSLAIRQPLTPDTWKMIEAIAPAMHASHLFGVNSKDQAAAIMLKGFELGLPLAASFEFIVVIQGKPTLIPRGALALLHQSGQLESMRITEELDSCTVYMKRRGGFEYEVTYTIADATKAGLVKPGSAWEMYPSNMLRWRAIGFCADVVAPDILGGMKRADELGAVVNAAGDVVEGQWEIKDKPAAPVMPPPVAPTLQDLLEKYSAEAIVVACEGKLPATDEEVARAAEVLSQQNG